jgi:hypothetical protein
LRWTFPVEKAVLSCFANVDAQAEDVVLEQELPTGITIAKIDQAALILELAARTLYRSPRSIDVVDHAFELYLTHS